MNSKRPRYLVVVILLAGLAAVGAWRLRTASSGAEGKEGAAPAAGKGRRARGPMVRSVSVSLAEVTTGAIQERLALTGALKPKEQVAVTPKETGRVEKIYVHIGDFVKPGDLVAELEDAELQQQVNRAEAALAVAVASGSQREAELSNARAELGRAEELLKDGLISKQDFEARKTSYEVVQAQVRLSQAQGRQAEAELRELRIRLGQAKIYAPIRGQVAERHVDVGALVSPSTPVVRVVNLATLVTAANVPEREVGKLRVGNRATVRVDAFGDQSFQGRVARIGPVLDAATRSATIEIEINNPRNLLRAEMFARVELDLATTRQAVLIPRDGLVYRGQQPGVFLVDKDRPVFQAIETGLSQGDQVEVLANLKPGTVIVARGASMLTEGDRIVVAGEGRRARSPVPES